MMFSLGRSEGLLIRIASAGAFVMLLSCVHSETATRGTVKEPPADVMTALEMLKSGQIRFEGGDGSSLEDAVVIMGAADTRIGLGAEYLWVSNIHGERGTNWKVKSREYAPTNGRSYEKATITLFGQSRGERVYWFDITDFYGAPTPD